MTTTRDGASGAGGYRPIGAMMREGGTFTATGTSGGAPAWRYADSHGNRVEVALLAPDLARVRLMPAGAEAAPSWAVARTEWPIFDVRTDVGENGVLRLTTDAMRLELAPEPFRLACSWPDGVPFAEDDPALGMGVVGELDPAELAERALPVGSVCCYKRLAPGERILGAGERTSPLDRRGERLVYWNSDPPQPHGADTRAMYATIPFWLGVRQGRAYGIFLDSVWLVDLDAGASRPDQLCFSAAGGDLTYYVFAGPSPADVLARYADLTGHMPLPPRWALGYGQSRWSYFPEGPVRAIAAGFRQRHIPCDHLWLDIDYMDGYRVFTWNPRRFPDPPALLRDLAAQGFRVVTIVDPGVKADPTDPTFVEGVERDYFVRRADGSLFTGVIWPGESAFPDFSRAEVRQWWGERQRVLLEAGVAGIWDDMNEPSLTDRLVPDGGTPHGTTLPLDSLHRPYGPDGPALPHAAFHNAYGLQMARASFEGLTKARPDERPFVLSRAGYAGIQRYAALWTGDNSSSWQHLRLAARMCLALGLSGVPFVGFDTGGFWGDATGPLLVRFTQLGAVFPFFRNHSAMDTPSQEPWVFGEPFTTFCREAIELRYRLLPYLYTLFEEAARTGAPIARPLAYAFPDEESLIAVEDEHLLGADLLAAPVMRPDELRRVVEFPRGVWVDWWTGQRFAGPLRTRVDSPLDTLPLFVREGAVVPLAPVMEYVGQRPQSPITLASYLAPEQDATAAGQFYEDDGHSLGYQRGVWRRTRANVERHGAAISVALSTEGSYDAERPDLIVELHLPRDDRQPLALGSVRRGEESLPVEQCEVIPRRYDTLVRVPAGQLTSGTLTVEVTLA
jgi:alpha-glucosidase